MLGSVEDGTLCLEEVHRFPNTPIRSGDSLHWDISRLVEELKAGLRKVSLRKLPLASISTDSWGVDYLLFDAASALLLPAFHYRDPRTQLGVEKVLAQLSWPAIFDETGIQFMPLNTLFQLAAESAERLRKTHMILGIADGFNFLLGGRPALEESMASTFQLFDPRKGAWSERLLKLLGLAPAVFPPLVRSGTPLGTLSLALQRETGLPAIEVIASCSHDTAAAVAAVPASGDSWAYISSGTWSLMGVERKDPVITDTCRELNFTNEIGYGSSVRLLKNISGLWLVQESRRDWANAGREYSYAELTQLADQATAFRSLINPMDARFLRPGDMPARIAEFCRETGQLIPVTPGEVIRCVLESLALLYRRTLRQIEQLLGHKIERLHVVGGGSKNELLNQFTADALEIPVVAGPVEATAAGNVLVQALSLGHLPSLAAARQIVRESMDLRTIQPQRELNWAAAYERCSRWL